jgi:hypothetical protein
MKLFILFGVNFSHYIFENIMIHQAIVNTNQKSRKIVITADSPTIAIGCNLHLKEPISAGSVGYAAENSDESEREFKYLL